MEQEIIQILNEINTTIAIGFITVLITMTVLAIATHK